MMRAIGSCLLAVLLAACIANRSFSGSDDGSSPPTSDFAVTPAEATVAAGATQQFSASVDDGGAVIWQVDGVSGGNATVGTISADGLYTAPLLPPAGGSATVTAVSGADSDKVGSALVDIDYSNASLQGAYVFSWRGTVASGPFAAIGRFEADGNGGIDSGREDINLPGGVYLDLAFNGSYEIAANGTGQAVLVSSRGSVELRFTIGRHGGAEVIRVDSGAAAAGEILPQGDDVPATLAGDYVFRVGGTGEAALQSETVGRFTGDDGAIGAGLLDRNRGGAVVRGVPFSGEYAVGDAGHGTMRLSDTRSIDRYTFYIASSGEILLLRVDAGVPFTGRALEQDSGDFGDSDLSGDYAFYLFGSGGTMAAATAGLFNAGGDGNIGDGLFSSNEGVIQQSTALTGTYAIDAGGRGIATFFSPGGRTDMAFYMQSPDHALVLAFDAAVRGGEFIAQPGDDFTTAVLDGPYTLASAGVDNTLVGRLVLDGDGKVADGVELAAAGGTPQAIALDGSYTMEPVGRGELALLTEGGGREDYIIWVIDPARALLLGSGPGAISLAWLRLQWPAADGQGEAQ
ncbi:MAG TPA: Ig-like domain-containing protein [Gammaproteobacteria bacterium]|nr:Ig-like domain-containing protein [Gammaproteobacteria bacterium]